MDGLTMKLEMVVEQREAQAAELRDYRTKAEETFAQLKDERDAAKKEAAALREKNAHAMDKISELESDLELFHKMTEERLGVRVA